MALQSVELKRSFTFKKGGKDIELTDPNTSISPEEVMKFHAAKHPELTNGVVEGPVVNKDQANYSFTTKAGKLG